MVSELSVGIVGQFHSLVARASHNPASHCCHSRRSKDAKRNQSIERAIQQLAWLHGNRLKSNQPVWNSPSARLSGKHTQLQTFTNWSVAWSFAKVGTRHMPVSFCEEKAFRFQHCDPGGPGGLNHPAVGCILLWVDSQRGHLHSQTAHWTIGVLVRVTEPASSQSACVSFWQQDGQHWGSVLIPLAAVHCIRQDNLSIGDSGGALSTTLSR